MARRARLPQEDEPDIGQDVAQPPELQAMEGDGEASGGRRGHLRSVPDPEEDRDLYNEHGDEGDEDEEERSRLSAVDGGGESTPRRRGHLRDAKKDKDEDDENKPDERLGQGYVDAAPNRLARVRRKFTRRRVAFGSAFGIFGFGGAAVLFLMLIPLKVENLVQNVENRYFATSENAVGTETDNLFKGWIKTNLASTLQKGRCAHEGRVIVSKDCTVHVAGNGKDPITNLYKTWSNAHLEDKLSSQYGIELRYDPGGKGTFYLKAPGISGNGDVVGDGIKGIDSHAFAAVDRGTVRQSFLDAEKGMTLWEKVMFRYKVGRLLEEKYGIKRCIIFCSIRDKFTNWKNNKKYAAKALLVDRVIEPHSAAMGAVIGCLFDQNQCDERQSTTTCAESNCDELSGEPETKANAEVEKAVGEASSKFGSETADEVIKHIKGIRDAGGIQNYVLKTIFSKIFGEDIGPKAVPVVGWLQMLNSLAHLIAKGAQAALIIKGFAYLVNSQAAVSTYTTFRTYADEIHTGHVDPTIVGSFTNALGPGNQCAQPLEGTCGNQVGGTAGAEQTPLYNAVIGGNKPQLASAAQTSLLGSLISPKVFADSTSSTSSKGPAYTCNNGQPVPKSTYPACPEEVFGPKPNQPQTNGSISALSSALNTSGLASLANGWNSIPGLSAVLNIGNDLLGWLASGAASGLQGAIKLLPGGAAVLSQAASEAGKFFIFLGSQLIQPITSIDQSGGRTGDLVILGGAKSGYDYAHQGLGGQALTPQQAADILTKQQQIEQQQFNSRPFFARMFSTDTPDSLISKFADDIPFGLQNDLQRGFANLVNPLSAISHGFAAVFSGRVSAADKFKPLMDPGGLRPYGLTSADIAKVDTAAKATAYWDQNCSDNASYAYMKTNSWNDQAAHTTDPNTGQPMNTQANLCAFLKGVQGSAGGALDTSNLTQADLADLNGSGGTGGSGGAPPAPVTGGFTNPFPDGWTPGRLDMGYDGTFKNRIVSPCSGTMAYVNPDDNHDYNGGWNGAWFAVKCDQSIPGFASNIFYFTEGVYPTVTQGQTVSAGQQIGKPGWTGYQEGPGGIEWGLADPDALSNELTLASKLGAQQCDKGGATAQSKAMVLSFAQWVHQNLNVAKPASTNDAGCA